jgi:predicted metal-dependent HD superfamily phosphohydrolase
LKLEKIKDYILCTKKHFEVNEYKDEDLNLFLDLDLSGFALNNKDYLDNSSMIEFEFRHHLTEDQWNKGRKMFLISVLKKEKIFRSDLYYVRYEKIARENSQVEINKLSN